MSPRLRRILRWTLLTFAVLVLAGAIVGGVLYARISSGLPDVETLREVELQEPMYVHASDGSLIAVFGEMRRYPVSIDEVPERFKQAFIAIEDSSFYEHHGVDFKGVARAVWLLLTTDDERVPGGSTITQQVARQFFLSTEYSYTRKAAEMLLAFRMERELSKDEIFELYLNNSFFGNRAYGVSAAAEFYYGKKLAELELDEMAALAGTPKFPSSANPLSNPERSKVRRDYILERMELLGFISPAERAAAQATAMHASPHEPPIELYAPYIAEMVRQEMVERYGAEALTRGYRVTTTIDADMQRAANTAVRNGLVTYDRRHGWRGAEQKFELGGDEGAEEAKARLRTIATQVDMIPAIVLATQDASATVVLPSGREVELGSDDGWGNRSPGSLLERGDMVRVYRDTTDEEEEAEGTEEGQEASTPPRYRLTQIPAAQTALVTMEARTGALRALNGGFSFAGSKFNRATQAKRQPGSSYKPFLYAAALEKGYNPASVVVDAPVVFQDRAGNVWRPQNDDGKFVGPMRLREALVRSRNLVSVRMLDTIGIDYARNYISHFGFDKDSLPPNLSMSLGTASLTPLSIARGYAAFANGGFRVDPWLIDEVRDRDGVVIFKEEPVVACRECSGQAGSSVARQTDNTVGGFNFGPSAPPEPEQDPEAADEPPSQVVTLPADAELAPRAIDPRVAWQMHSILKDVVKRGTGRAALALEREDVGGKTGSTNEHRDAWFSGFGGGLVTTVWVGRDDFTSLGRGEYGGRAALPVWIELMEAALEDRPVTDDTPPEGMVRVAVAANGRLLPEGSGGIQEWVKVEDLERMQGWSDWGPDESLPTEEVFDIF